MGRQSVTTIDAKGRLVQAAVAGIAPVQFAYDGRGRLASLTQDDRTYTFTYDSQGYVSLLTDPLTRSVGFTHDTAGRPTLLTRPDGEQIGFTYDANGNLASLTPPGRPSHTFSYTPIDLLQSYAPPDLGFTPKDTQYVYNPDRQLIQLSQPDVSASLSYDAAGRVQSLTHPQDTVTLRLRLRQPTPDDRHIERDQPGLWVRWASAHGHHLVWTGDRHNPPHV